MFDHHPILYRSGGCVVFDDKHVVEMPDGTTLALYPLTMNGYNDMWRRAVVLDGGLCLVFDLRSICPPLREDLVETMQRDHSGCIKYRMRAGYNSAAAALTRIANEADMCITPSPAARDVGKQSVAA